MKTKTFLITVLLVCSFSFLYAEGPEIIIIKSHSMTIEIRLIDEISWLAPETPGEATFEDSEPESASGIVRLAPITPKEATFDDLAADPSFPSEKLATLVNIKPETPEAADFEETSGSGDNLVKDILELDSIAFSALK